MSCALSRGASRHKDQSTLVDRVRRLRHPELTTLCREQVGRRPETKYRCSSLNPDHTRTTVKLGGGHVTITWGTRQPVSRTTYDTRVLKGLRTQETGPSGIVPSLNRLTLRYALFLIQ